MNALDKLHEQHVRLMDAIGTLSCIRAALTEPEDAAAMASNAESALCVLIPVLEDIDEQLDLAHMALARTGVDHE